LLWAPISTTSKEEAMTFSDNHLSARLLSLLVRSEVSLKSYYAREILGRAVGLYEACPEMGRPSLWEGIETLAAALAAEETLNRAVAARRLREMGRLVAEAIVAEEGRRELARVAKGLLAGRYRSSEDCRQVRLGRHLARSQGKDLLALLLGVEEAREARDKVEEDWKECRTWANLAGLRLAKAKHNEALAAFKRAAGLRAKPAHKTGENFLSEEEPLLAETKTRVKRFSPPSRCCGLKEIYSFSDGGEKTIACGPGHNPPTKVLATWDEAPGSWFSRKLAREQKEARLAARRAGRKVLARLEAKSVSNHDDEMDGEEFLAIQNRMELGL